jgi:ergothioneine biosynthesis protein EgtB
MAKATWNGTSAPSPTAPPQGAPAGRSLERYLEVRSFTEKLAEPLATEDYVVQSMPDVSPTKWHLAHVTWFFETFVLLPHLDGYEPLDPAYQYLFNSYYLGAGERHCRDQRGYLSRPTVEEVYSYRRHVDRHLGELLDGRLDPGKSKEILRVLEIGLQHEQQHQELLLTDIKHVFSVNPLRPRYCSTGGDRERGQQDVPPLGWLPTREGLFEIGHELGSGFAFDNETPRHRYFVQGFELADRLVTNGEYLEFLEDGGYARGELWLSEGWAAARANGWSEPFYWEEKDGEWHCHTLGGSGPVDMAEPVCHVNYFEADAYARWAGARLPSEQEWEVVAARHPVEGNFVESGRFHPAPAAAGGEEGPAVEQLFGDVWEWTRSQYSPYPGYRPLPGTLGEYNGKFMSNQFVLRGGSCATSVSHIRRTYRNFFPADASWQFSGIRLARDV